MAPTAQAMLKGGAWLIEPTSPEQVFTPEKLTDEHKLIAQTAEQFVSQEAVPALPKLEQHDWNVGSRLEARAKELGLWLPDVPEEYGGQGLSLLGMAVIWEELARTIALPPRGPGIFGPEVRPLLFALAPEQKK